MGLSRKLGGGAAGGTSSRPDTPTRVDYKWSTQAYALQDILTRFQLPCVVQCAADPGAVVWADFRFDLGQPLLLHAARTVRKVHARSLQPGGQTEQLEEFGPPLAIPEDYDGWFFPVSKKDPTFLPRYTRIEGAAASPARQLLLTTRLPAFVPASVWSAAGCRYAPHEVSIGEVLTKVDVINGDLSLTEASPLTTLTPSTGSCQSLRCLDESEHEVIVPFNHCALLHDVAENYEAGVKATLAAATQRRGSSAAGSEESSSAGDAGGDGGSGAAAPWVTGVVNTRTIVSAGNACLPRVFRHVLGERPSLEAAFTGLVRCYTVFTEETVMAATMSRDNLASTWELPSCLELSANSTAKFKIALNASELKRTTQYVAALRTCEELAPGYVRAIKTSFTVRPVASESGDADSPVCDNGSDPAAGLEEEDRGKEASESSADDEVKFQHRQAASASSAAVRAWTADRAGADDDAEDSSITESASDAPDDSADVTSLSDAPEVEASSEFHISWGELKRARSYSGSLSDDSDDTLSSATDSDTQMSMAQPSSATESDCNSLAISDDNSVINSDDSTVVISDNNSSISQDSVVDLCRARIKSTDCVNANHFKPLAKHEIHLDICSLSRDWSTASSGCHANASACRLETPEPSRSHKQESVQQAASWATTCKKSIPEPPHKLMIPEKTGMMPVARDMPSANSSRSHDFQIMDSTLAKNSSWSSSQNTANGQYSAHQKASNESRAMSERSRTFTASTMPQNSAVLTQDGCLQQRRGSASDSSLATKIVAQRTRSRSSSDLLASHSLPSSFPSGLDLFASQWAARKRAQGVADVERDRRHNYHDRTDDIVKSLGDKLLLVSKRSSSPRYHRLETSDEDAENYSNTAPATTDGRGVAQKQHSRSVSSIAYDRSVHSAHDLVQSEETIFMVQDSSFSMDSDDDSAAEASGKSIFDQFDLLHEEIV